MILSDCSKLKYGRTIFLQKIPLVLEIRLDRKDKQLYMPAVRNESIIATTKMSISSDCSKCIYPLKLNFYIFCIFDFGLVDGTIFKLETDDYNSGSVAFNVITTYNKENISNFVKDIMGADIKILLLYIFLLNYIGKNLLRKTFFDQQAMIWYT